MSDTLFDTRPRNMDTMRVHDYLYDSAFIVSGARDYARTAFKAAMDSAQVSLQPVYKFMFSELRMFPRMQVVYYPNCRLPEHMDRSYAAYLVRQQESRMLPTPQLAGRDQYKFTARPKKVLDVPSVTPAFHPASPVFDAVGQAKPRNRGTQSRYRESSAQTTPWQPDAKPAPDCENVPEVMYLDKLEWGPGKPYRTGDLPADFHTTEIINKMRHARKWNELVEKAEFPRWMKKRDEIISDVETKDWIFREAEIDELQDIRLELLHRLQTQQRTKQSTRTSRKLAQLWAAKKREMEAKIDRIRKTRDRELRKLSALHDGGGRAGLAQRIRAARGAGPVTQQACQPASDLHAPAARHGYQARRRHADIYYDPSLLALEDHEKIAAPPAWLENCGQDLKKSCSGHHLPRDPMKLCERETKWSEQFLENLHNDLKKARLGATATAGPLRVLKPRRLGPAPRPSTPQADVVQPDDELCHQAALTLQRILRGRAVQTLMYEGRTRAAELTEELKTTHGLQKEDQIHIAKEEARARDHHVIRADADQKEDAITALVDELCGGAVSAALDFLEKELRRLKEERRQHAFILIALREKVMREAAEAGRRQKEEHRRREHDEMFKQVLGVTQETVDAYFRDIVQQGVELAAEEEAVRRAETSADRVDRALLEDEAMSTAEQNELVAELVQQFLLPATHKCASRHRVSSLQQARTEAARQTIFGVIDDAEIKESQCIRCGQPLGELCRCRVCPVSQEPAQTEHRHDRRWQYTRGKPHTPEKTYEERFPIQHDVRCMLNQLMDDVVVESRRRISDELFVSRDCGERLKELVEVTLDAMETVAEMVSIATGETEPSRRRDYRHYSRHIRPDALDRTEAVIPKCLCPEDLPSEIRARAEEEARRLDPTCYCEPEDPSASRVRMLMDITPAEKIQLLPSELRALEDLRRCKCNTVPTPATESTYDAEEEMTEEVDNATDYADTYNSSDV